MGNEKAIDDWADDVLAVLVLFVVVPSLMVGGIVAGVWWAMRDDEPQGTPGVEWTEVPAGWSQPTDLDCFIYTDSAAGLSWRPCADGGR